MAEALWRDLGDGTWQADSAGSAPVGYVHSLAIEAMTEIGLDLTSARSKSVEEFMDQTIDLVVTVCDSARDSCAVLPGARAMLHWPFEDPAEASGTDEERLWVFRRVREQIRAKISSHLESGD